jgi:hypothetical protein
MQFALRSSGRVSTQAMGQVWVFGQDLQDLRDGELGGVSWIGLEEDETSGACDCPYSDHKRTEAGGDYSHWAHFHAGRGPGWFDRAHHRCGEGDEDRDGRRR